MPTIPCPFRRCHEAHEVRTAKNGRSFVSCEASRNKFFANSPASEAYFGNNGGATRSNPVGNRDHPGRTVITEGRSVVFDGDEVIDVDDYL